VASFGIVGARGKMEVPNALSTPITAFADSRERLVAQVGG
jgi:hypothetical protein